MTMKYGQKNKNINELEHFINDVKYVTSSMSSDRRGVLQKYNSDIFSIDPAAIKERFAMEYEAFFQMIDSKLHTDQAPIEGTQTRKLLCEYETTVRQLKSQLDRTMELKADLREKFGLCVGESFAQITMIKKIGKQLVSNIIPAQSWLFTDNYDKICSWINEAQTMVEDEIKARKRIQKVWKEEILQPEYEAVVDSFLKHNDTGFKIFQGSYWSERKKLRSMFIEDISLLNDQEYKVLWNNLKLLKNSQNWRKEQNETLLLVIGSSYQGLDTDFEAIRRQYDALYSLMEVCNEWTMNTTIVDTKKQVALRETLATEQGFYTFYELLNSMDSILPKLCQQMLLQCYPWFEEAKADEYSIGTLHEVVTESNVVISHLKTDYYMLYEKLRSGQEELSIEQIRKTIYQLERIHQKEEWLHQNEEKITTLIGPIETLKNTDWDQIRRKVLTNEKKEKNSVPEFICYKPIEIEEVSDCFLEEVASADAVLKKIVESEQPIHLNLLLKRAVSLLGMTRVTKSLKERAQIVIEEMKTQGYCYENDFIWIGDAVSIAFRKNGSDQGKRDLAMIAPIELKAGIYRLVEGYGEVKTEEISKQIAKLLGMPRRNQSFLALIEQAVFSLKREGLIVRHSGGWRIMSK